MELVKLFKMITLANEELSLYNDEKSGFISAGIAHDEEFNRIPELLLTEGAFKEVASKLALIVRQNGHFLYAEFAGVQFTCIERVKSDD